jgi:hypothetical protein
MARYLRIRMPHLFDTVTFSAPIIRETADTYVVRIPDRIRALRWTYYPSRAYVFQRSKRVESAVFERHSRNISTANQSVSDIRGS